MNASVSVVCYTSKTLANGENPLMLQINKSGKRKYKSLGLSINSKYWDSSKNKLKSNCPHFERLQKIILDKQAEIQDQILELNCEQKEYTPETLLGRQQFKLKTVKEFYEDLIAEYERMNKQGNRRVYKGSYNSLKTFTKGNLNILFSDIDNNWLKRYEKWLRSKDNKETTISLLFRTLRSAYNKAIESKCVSKNSYPFNDYKVSKFDVTTKKRAIAKGDIIRIMGLDLSSSSGYLRFSRDVFVFSYFCGGINFTDIANLKPENVKKDRVEYIRQKTGKLIRIPLQDQAMKILEVYRQEKNYLFPILDKRFHKTASQKENRIHKVLGKVDKNLKEIGAMVGLEIPLTTYVARHSFASVLKKSGVSVSLISEALGHSDLATTQIYLDSFDNEQVDEAMKNLL